VFLDTRYRIQGCDWKTGIPEQNRPKAGFVFLDTRYRIQGCDWKTDRTLGVVRLSLGEKAVLYFLIEEHTCGIFIRKA
jgi:hypothetical protein